MIGTFPIAVVIGCALVASITDISKFKVYNALTIPCFFGGLAYGWATAGWTGLSMALAGAFFGVTILLIPYLMGGLGAGDVKFVMAIGTWIGPTLLVPTILIGCIATLCYFFSMVGRNQGFRGLLHSLHLLSLRMSVFGRNFACDDEFESVQDVAKGANPHGRLIPFSAMISVGIVISIVVGAFWYRG